MSSSPNGPVAISRAPHGVPAARACTGSPPPVRKSREPRPGGVVLTIAAAELIRGLSPRRYSLMSASRARPARAAARQPRAPRPGAG